MASMRTYLPIIIGGAVALVATAAWAFAGDDSGGGNVEGPTTVTPPQGADDIAEARTFMCTAFRGGADTKPELVMLTLAKVYPSVDWKTLMGGPLERVATSTRDTVALFSKWADELLALTTDSDREVWCGEHVEPVILEPVFPEGPPEEPKKPTTPQAPAKPPKVEPSPPPAPFWDARAIVGEATAVDVTVQQYLLGQIQVPAGTSNDDFLTDYAGKMAYNTWPTVIPKNWDKGDKGISGTNPLGWQSWVDTWWRIRKLVIERLDQG